jgi:hypothetical protein
MDMLIVVIFVSIVIMLLIQSHGMLLMLLVLLYLIKISTLVCIIPTIISEAPLHSNYIHALSMCIGFRRYSYDRDVHPSTFLVKEFEQYWMDISLANQLNKITDWGVVRYKASEWYGMKDLSPHSWQV